jgi:hypothetical protein
MYLAPPPDRLRICTSAAICALSRPMANVIGGVLTDSARAPGQGLRGTRVHVVRGGGLATVRRCGGGSRAPESPKLPVTVTACSGQDFVAFQEPLPVAFPPAATFQVPDIELPDTEPVYVIACEPTVPKVIWLPCSEPLIGVSALP